MKSQLFIPSVILLLVILSSCTRSDDAGQIIDNTKTTFEIISESPSHNILEQLLIDSGLNLILDEGIFTVFAPTDDAFIDIDINGLTPGEVEKLLLNHTLRGKAESTDLSNAYFITNATESFTGDNNFINVYVNIDGGITLNGISSVITADVQASNGVIHIIDNVIPIPEVSTFITADSNLETLFTALTRDDQPDFIGLLGSYDSLAPFTVFSPTNAAFDNLLIELEIDSLDSIDTTSLTSALNTHVVSGSIIRTNDMTSGTLSTLGGDIEVNAENEVITDQNGRIITIGVKDIQAGNGVIHLVDKVILPSVN